MSAELLRYLGAGVVNTLVGYLAFLAVLHGLSASVGLANAVSYAIGLVCAYVLNRRFVFKTAAPAAAAPWKFAAGFGVAFGVNLLVLHVAASMLRLRPELAQLFAMGAYTVTFYFINKYVVFARADRAA